MDSKSGMKNSILNIMEKLIFPALLFVYPLLGAGYGADLSDTTYSLSNYMYFPTLSGSWKYATFLANLSGYGLINIAGHRMYIMNILTSIIISAIALFIYFNFRNKMNAVMLFICEIIAICLCWCPSVILYNYLTYLLFTIGAVILYKAIVNDSRKYYILAGIILGINLFVRISNAVEVLLIIAVWYSGIIKKYDFKKIISCTGYAVLGYIIGAVAGIIAMIISGGTKSIGEVMEWVLGLATSNDSTGGYSIGEMILTIFKNYAMNVKWLVFIILGILLGIGGFKVFKDRFILIKKVGYLACVLVLFFYFYRNGVYTTAFYNNYCVFKLCAVCMMIMLGLLVYCIICKKYSYEDKALAMIALLIMIITPLGSNNHLFTIINSMFLILPVSINIALRIVTEYKDSVEIYPVIAMGTVLIGVLFVFSMLFKMGFVFKDSGEGEKRDTSITVSITMSGMKTNKSHAISIDELASYMSNKADESLLLYGDIPGVSYMLNMPVVIDTSWPDLDSYSYKSFAEAIDGIDGKMPIVIVSQDKYIKVRCSENDKDAKFVEFIDANYYDIAFSNDEFVVLIAGNDKENR